MLPMLRFSFRLGNFEAATNQVVAYVSNPSSARGMVADFVRRTIQGYFKKQSGPGGIQWAPISPSWKRQKQALGFSTQILVMRGDLEASIESEVRGREIETYTDLPYAGALDSGDPPNLPARRFMDLGPVEREVAGEIYLNGVEEAWI